MNKIRYSILAFVTILLLSIAIFLVMRGILFVPQSIHILFIDIKLYGLIIGIAIVSVSLLVEYHLLDTQKYLIREGLILVILPAIIFARIYHVVTDFQLYQDNLIGIFEIWNGGLGIFGGIFGGVLGGILFFWRQNVPIIPTSTLIFVFLPIGQAIGRLGNLVNQEIFGTPTSLPWAEYIRVENRPKEYVNFEYFHPAFLYEMVGNIILFSILYNIYQSIEEKKRWVIIPLYFIGYSSIRFIVEFFRINTKYFFSLSVAQIVALIIILLSLLILWVGHIRKYSNIHKTSSD